ncbi:MAG: ACT domain-containing protein [Candidatus Bilamarchaeum sp.]|jgi:hypothetical protein
MESVSELVWLYIKRRPFLKEIIREKIVNYSALARKIAIEVFGTKKNQFAIKMSLIRLSEKIREKEEDLEGKILKVLKRSSMSIKTKVTVIITQKELPALKYLSYSESKSGITYIVDEEEFNKIRRPKSAVKIEQNLNLISIHSPKDLEDTPGVIAHILDALSSEGINIVEFVSCYTDTILVVKQSDTSRAHEILGNMMN